MQDPSGINKAELDSILNHWQDRVDKDLEPFQFRDSEPPDNSEDDEKKLSQFSFATPLLDISHRPTPVAHMVVLPP